MQGTRRRHFVEGNPTKYGRRSRSMTRSRRSCHLGHEASRMGPHCVGRIRVDCRMSRGKCLCRLPSWNARQKELRESGRFTGLPNPVHFENSPSTGVRRVAPETRDFLGRSTEHESSVSCSGKRNVCDSHVPVNAYNLLNHDSGNSPKFACVHRVCSSTLSLCTAMHIAHAVTFSS